VIGTPPSARAECGFTAIGSRLFVFAGQTTLPDNSAFGDKVYPLLPFVWLLNQCWSNSEWHAHNFALIVTLNDLHQFDLITLQWSEISRDVEIPAALSFRLGFGFAAVGQSLYVFGGSSRSAGAQFRMDLTKAQSKTCFIRFSHLPVQDTCEHTHLLASLSWQ
jgi:hypothetical protein